MQDTPRKTLIPLQGETMFFIFVSAMDLLITLMLLWFSAEGSLERVRVVESNAIAKYMLAHWGLKGMVVFKLGVVSFVIFISQWIARKRLKTARWLLNFGTLLTGVVVFYSLFLLRRHAGWI